MKIHGHGRQIFIETFSGFAYWWWIIQQWISLFRHVFLLFTFIFTDCNFFGCTCPTAPLWYLPIFLSGCAAEMLLTLLDVFIFWIFPRWLERFVQRLLYLCYFEEKRLFSDCPFVSILFNLFEIKMLMTSCTNLRLGMLYMVQSCSYY